MQNECAPDFPFSAENANPVWAKKGYHKRFEEGRSVLQGQIFLDHFRAIIRPTTPQKKIPFTDPPFGRISPPMEAGNLS